MQLAQQILTKTFGYADFRHHQAEIISSIITGQDALVLMPTGGGNLSVIRYRHWCVPGLVLLSPRLLR